MNPLQAGKLRHKVQLQSTTVSKDNFGGEVTTYSTYATVWAAISKVNEQGAAENDDGNRTFSASSFDVVIRYNGAVRTGDFVLYNGNRYDINAVDNVDMNNVYIALRCSRTD